MVEWDSGGQGSGNDLVGKRGDKVRDGGKNITVRGRVGVKKPGGDGFTHHTERRIPHRTDGRIH